MLKPTHDVTPDPSTHYEGTVASVTPQSSKYGPTYAFTFTDGTIIEEKQDKVHEQIDNPRYPQYGLSQKGIYSVNDFVGQRLKFTRKPMNGDMTKGFLNIFLQSTPPRTPTSPVPVRTPVGAGAGNGAKKQPFTAGAVNIPGLDDFDIVGGGETEEEFAQRMQTPPQPARAAAPAARPSTTTLVPTLIEKHEAAQRMYEKHFAWAVEKIVPQCNEHGLNYDLDAINGVIATVMIQGYK